MFLKISDNIRKMKCQIFRVKSIIILQKSKGWKLWKMIFLLFNNTHRATISIWPLTFNCYIKFSLTSKVSKINTITCTCIYVIYLKDKSQIHFSEVEVIIVSSVSMKAPVLFDECSEFGGNQWAKTKIFQQCNDDCRWLWPEYTLQQPIT